MIQYHNRTIILYLYVLNYVTETYQQQLRFGIEGLSDKNALNYLFISNNASEMYH